MGKTIDIFGLGYCGLDTLCVVPRIPVDDKVQILQTLVQGGGPAATAMVTAARLGLRAAFLGVIGDDARGAAIVGEFEKDSVSTEHMRRRVGAESAAAFCWIEAATGKRSIAWTHGSAPALLPAELPVELLCSARALHCDGHQTHAAIHAAAIAQAHAIPVFLDAGTIVPGIEDLIALCNVVIASEAFARKFTGRNDLEDAIRHLHGLGPQWTGATLGTAGSVGFDGQSIHRVRSFPVDVVDTTGAGDVYHGAFAARYMEQRDSVPNMEDCMRFATVVAGLKCRALGGRTSIPTRQEAAEAMACWPAS